MYFSIDFFLIFKALDSIEIQTPHDTHTADLLDFHLKNEARCEIFLPARMFVKLLLSSVQLQTTFTENAKINK